MPLLSDVKKCAYECVYEENKAGRIQVVFQTPIENSLVLNSGSWTRYGPGKKILLIFAAELVNLESEDLLDHPLFTSFPHQKEAVTGKYKLKFFLFTDPQSDLLLLIKHRYAAPYEKS